jgi:hypothetical protein
LRLAEEKWIKNEFLAGVCLESIGEHQGKRKHWEPAEAGANGSLTSECFIEEVMVELSLKNR